jgi:hypothetical protein
MSHKIIFWSLDIGFYPWTLGVVPRTIYCEKPHIGSYMKMVKALKHIHGQQNLLMGYVFQLAAKYPL